MWKPGTAKPKNTPTKDQTNASDNKGPKGAPASGTTPKTKLSNSTMGMRFMQRKNDTRNKEEEETKAFQQTAAARKNHATNNNESVVSNRSDNGNSDRKRESEDISKDEQSASDGLIILGLASVVDMYGVGSDVVGRRSFGGFHKPVRTTWEAALKRRTDDDARTRNTKSHITDEELLQRYEKYVKGGRSEEGGGSGNRGRKDKRKQRN
mmetsp:Transcript_17932/g.32465  ORF Transcript_17932/g.32465 Transcript_17932/m.32465 type:complete len:209 (-) Transcript_17932:169-795(-)